MSGLVRVGAQNPAELFMVGLPLQLTLALAAEDLCCEGTLLGWKVGTYLIIDLPLREALSAELSPGTPCEVRHLFAGRFMGYHSEIRAVQTIPEPLLFLAFPQRIEEVLARKHPRVQMRQTVQMTLSARSVAHPEVLEPVTFCGTIEDLSTAGCRIELTQTGEPPSPGAVVKLEFDLPGLGRVANLTGRLKYWRTEPMRVLAGIEFKFHQAEFIEFKGWGGTVKRAIEQFVVMRHGPWSAGDSFWGIRD